MEVNVPVRFLFVLLGPEDEQNKYHETGRSIAAMMSDKFFLSLVYNFKVHAYVFRICQGRRKIDNWGGGAHIHIFEFTDCVKTIDFKI